ncbi:MAG: type I 3-dehydroquinate dehydratase [Streptococcaceae bacterium]|jgi:3-dehydroquinate dehydratase-1|nr:type I 3-dehydroquinate dehydratase [Streptococcaceae bacterium]
MTKIVVPLILTSQNQAFDIAEFVAADIIEWRADYLAFAEILSVAKTVKERFKKPLLFTVRTKKEGGNLALSNQEYLQLLTELLELQPDYIDFEYFSYKEAIPEFKKRCKAKGVKLVVSYHNFKETPKDLEQTLNDLLVTNPDVVKIAVKPRSFDDVLKVLSLNNNYTNAAEETPSNKAELVMLSMGELGVITRVAADLIGAAWTFAIVNQSSAPGQLDINQTKELLKLFKGKRENEND